MIDEYEWRPITFQGIAFPATLMGVSILEPVIGGGGSSAQP